MSGESGYVMIELLLMLLIVSLCTQMCVPMMRLKERGDRITSDQQKMIELWQKEERCTVYCPVREAMPDLISLK